MTTIVAAGYDRVREGSMSREHALAIWQAAVDAVRPEPLVERRWRPRARIRRRAPRARRRGGEGRAGDGRGAGSGARDRLDRVEGW